MRDRRFSTDMLKGTQDIVQLVEFVTRNSYVGRALLETNVYVGKVAQSKHTNLETGYIMRGTAVICAAGELQQEFDTDEEYMQKFSQLVTSIHNSEPVQHIEDIISTTVYKNGFFNTKIGSTPNISISMNRLYAQSGEQFSMDYKIAISGTSTKWFDLNQWKEYVPPSKRKDTDNEK